MKYFIHNGSLFVPQREAASFRDMLPLMNEARQSARQVRDSAPDADHVVFAVQHYGGPDGALSEIDFYIPGVAMDDATFEERTACVYADDPGCIICALHRHR